MSPEHTVIAILFGTLVVTYCLSEIRAAVAMHVIKSQSRNITGLCECIDKLCAAIDEDALDEPAPSDKQRSAQQ